MLSPFSRAPEAPATRPKRRPRQNHNKTTARERWRSLCEEFPLAARGVLTALQAAVDARLEAAAVTLAGDDGAAAAGVQGAAAGNSSGLEGSSVSGGGSSGGLRPTRLQLVSSLARVQTTVRAAVARIDSARTYEFLEAAARGDARQLLVMLQQGMDPDVADYDARTALMLAAAKGHRGVVEALLEAGARPGMVDSLGHSALLEACDHGHDDVAALLVERGARLHLQGTALAARLCSLVHAGDIVALKRLLAVGADPAAADYDLRTALHVAAADGSLAAVKALVELGRLTEAVVSGLRDRWGNTPLDEARRVGALGVVGYLERVA